ncbi:SRPBCC family protein [Leucobacter zeae]|nr:SRPBCC family protein [Leucobacter zeae]
MEASGRVIATPRGRDLVLVRSLALPQEEAWAYLTDSELTERWFGPWEGDDRAGGSVRVRMRFEANEPAIRVRIVACEAPDRLALHTVDEYGNWELELRLESDGADDSLLTFTHHLDSDADVGDIGPGWEYYLDLLVAATEGTEQPNFDVYYPALREPYLAKLAEAPTA